MSSIHFHEKQRFIDLPIYILVGLLQALFLWGLIQQVLFDKPWGIKPVSDTVLILINSGVCLLFILFISINLTTDVPEENITAMRPMQHQNNYLYTNRCAQAKTIERHSTKLKHDYKTHKIRLINKTSGERRVESRLKTR